MSGIVLTIQIMTGKVEAWRRFCQELTGARSAMYEASRRRLGVTRERMALVETPFGSSAVTTLEARDIVRALTEIMTSVLPFDRWYLERAEELYGFNLTGYTQFAKPPLDPQSQELLFEWIELRHPGA
jgi:hypothetical protein